MASHESKTRKIIARLEREGWRNIGGGNYDRYLPPEHPLAFVIVPRHANVSPRVARNIAAAAGWIVRQSK